VTIVRDIHLDLEKRQILRGEGIRQQSSVRSEIITLIDELLVIIDGEHLLEPVCAYQIYPISSADHNALSPAENMVLHNPLLTSALSDTKELVTVVCTVGHKLEKKVTEYLGGSEPLRGLLLDGIGNAAVGSLTREVCKLIKDVAALRDCQAGSPCSPGMPGFPITEQWSLFQLVPAGEIGIRLTDAGLMAPRKSVSMVIGLGQKVKTWEPADICARCNLSGTCHYRSGG
jgi:hypothetical protein